MASTRITTSTLLQRLFKTENLSRFIGKHSEEMKVDPLSVYLSRLCDDRGVIVGEVIKKADIERTYGYQIFNGTRQLPLRDIVIKLAFGFEMGYDEAQGLLKTARKTALYARVERDAVFIFALNNKYNIFEVQSALEELGLPLLGKGGKLEK